MERLVMVSTTRLRLKTSGSAATCYQRRHLQSWEREELGIKVNLHAPRRICERNVSSDWYGKHVSRLSRCCRVVAGSGAFTTIWALMEMGSYGPAWQDPCTERCAVGFCFVCDLGGRRQDKLRDFLHRSPHAFNPKMEMSTRCQMC